MKRNSHLLCGKTISQYAIDRANFTTYLNFANMYNHIKKVLLLSKIATKFVPPVLMNEKGDIVSDEMKSFGYKVTINIERPDMGIVLDKCRCNFSQEGDGNVGGEKF